MEKNHTEETVFFDSNEIKVTNARFIAQGQTYAMSGITSVKSHEHKPKRGVPVVAFLIGLFILYLGIYVVGAIVLGFAFFVWIAQTQTKGYSVSIKTASGEEQALTSPDSQFISQVVNAINEAMVYRG